MKIVARSIEMVAWFSKDGIPHPVRFRISNEDETVSVIKVDKVIFREKEKIAGNNMLVFRCQSRIYGEEKIYEIKYDIITCKWILFKI